MGHPPLLTPVPRTSFIAMSPTLQLLALLPAVASAHLGVVGSIPAIASAHVHAISPIALHREHRARSAGSLALAIPGDSAAEALLIDGSLNFLSLYGGIITFRILLSWVPQAQGIELLRPIFTVSDVYLNLFRGVIPPIAGLDISPIAAFFVLNLLQNSVLSLGVSSHPVKPRAGMADRLRQQWAKRLAA